MNILVQKFGGTSVRNEEGRSLAIQHIQKAKNEGYKLVVVVSAMGRSGDPYATDTLLNLIDYPNHGVSNREQDLLVSCGEVISSVVFSNELNQAGLRSIALTGAQAGFVTNDDFTQAKIKAMKTDRILSELTHHDVVVVAGFQGQTESLETTTIGRGGSDTSAAALGASLQADYVDIFTDVEGIMTADPRIVESARPLSVMTYNEIVNLAYQGAKVIHPRAVEIAMQAKVPIRVRSTYSEEYGTLVTQTRSNEHGQDIPDRFVTGIAHMSGIAQIKVTAKEEPYQLQTDVFKSMAEAGISVDFINISPSGVIYTIPEVAVEKAKSILSGLGYEPEITYGCAKVSTVGAGITGVPGIASKIVGTLTAAGVNILQSADSHTTIWVLVKDEDLVKAVNALHHTFELDLKE
ncbi:aspartate kinase [Pontibacillus halophilus JSM 076056 = DSM 19796]|uniref:Aspartokinase n=1 Tax=Pontibacillus halophilus JSM 076056 = DSM 19796 TaxID=1385510 RepID=A0A0A5GPN2_9BACI|nr:aspartate kinase [Pontibacillus halophilus]KGX93120.1 aspartate kinase [Pontibacillus halophilus JSM 076056 = DSM 19796]